MKKNKAVQAERVRFVPKATGEVLDPGIARPVGKGPGKF